MKKKAFVRDFLAIVLVPLVFRRAWTPSVLARVADPQFFLFRLLARFAGLALVVGGRFCYRRLFLWSSVFGKASDWIKHRRLLRLSRRFWASAGSREGRAVIVIDSSQTAIVCSRAFSVSRQDWLVVEWLGFLQIAVSYWSRWRKCSIGGPEIGQKYRRCGDSSGSRMLRWYGVEVKIHIEQRWSWSGIIDITHMMIKGREGRCCRGRGNSNWFLRSVVSPWRIRSSNQEYWLWHTRKAKTRRGLIEKIDVSRCVRQFV